MAGFFKRATKPEASVSIILRRDTVGLGEELVGVLLVKSLEEFDAEEVRVEVTGVAPGAIPDGEGGRNDCTLWWILERISSPLHLTPGQEEEFHFRVKIPESPRLMRYGEQWRRRGFRGRLKVTRDADWLSKNPEWRNKIKWTVKGVIDTKGRRDVASSINFKVPMPPLVEEQKRYIQMRDMQRKAAATILIGIVFFFVGLILCVRSFISPIFAQDPNERIAGMVTSLFGLSLIIVGIYKYRKVLSKDIVKKMAEIFGRARVPDF